MAEDGKVVFKYVGDTSGIDSANAEAEKKVGGLGAKIGAVAAKAAVAVGAAAVAAGTATIKIGAEFESAFAGVIKTVDASEQELAALREGILDMSTELPATADEIAAVAEAAGQLGIETPNILEFTRTMIDLGEATNLTADEAATSLARFANIMQMPQTEFDKLGSSIVALGNNFATTEAEIVSMGMRLAGAGQQAGMSEADIMGFATALSSVGIEAEAGGTAMSKVFTDINIAVQTGNEDLAKFADVAGMSADEFKEAFEQDAAGAVAAFVSGLGKMEERGSSAILTLEDLGIKEVRMRDALLRASGAGDLLTESLATANKAWEENNALTTEAEQRYATVESKFDMLKNQLSAIAVDMYDALREPLVGVMNEFSATLDGMRDSGALDALGESLGQIATVLGESLVDMLPVLVELINTILPPVMELVKTALPPILDFIKALLPHIQRIISQLLPPLLQIIEALMPIILQLVDSVLPILVDILLPPLSTVLGIISSLLKTLEPILTPLLKLLGPVVSVILIPISDALNLIAGTLKIIIGLAETVIKVFGAIFGVNSWSDVGDSFKSTMGVFTDASPFYFTGGKKVGSNAKGSPFWRGGKTWVGEEGPELIDLPIGTRIYSAEASARMAATPNVSNSASTMIGKIEVYPDSEDYLRILSLLEQADRARQVERAGG